MGARTAGPRDVVSWIGVAVPLAVVLALVASVAYLGWRSRGWPLVHDAPLMHYVAWRLAHGAVPYRDLFDMNFPGTYLVHLVVLRVLGPGDAAWRAVDLGWLMATSLGVAVFAAPWGGVAAAGGALFFALYHLAAGAWQAGQRDFLLCLPVVLGGLGTARWLEGRSVSNLVWAGLVLGGGITLKPHALVFAGGLACVVLARGRRLAPAAAFAGGVALLPLAVVAWVAVRGGLGAWWWITRDYLVPLYSRLTEPDWHLHRGLIWIPIGLAAAITFASALVRGRFGARHGIAALGLGFGVAHYFGQGKGWDYHLYPLAAFATAALCAELVLLLDARRWRWAVPLVASLALALGGLVVKGAESSWAAEQGWIAAKEQRVGALVGALRGRLRPGDLVQVLDTTDGGIHALLRLGAAQPTRFIYDFHFFHDVQTPAIQTLRAELMQGLTRRPPRFIVLFARSWPRSGYDRVDGFPELRHYLASSYRAEPEQDGFIVYAKRDDS